MDPVTVLIVDDQHVFREVVRDVVSATPGMAVAGQASSGEEALEAVEALRPRLVMIDKRMPGIGGIEAARLISARHPEIVVVLMSVETPNSDTLDANGAVVFMHKRQVSPRSLTELWRAHGGG